MSQRFVSHAQAASQFLTDEARTDWHDETLWFIRQKRDKSAHALPEWEALRELASGIKDHALSELSTYLTQFEQNALANGIQVHWAATAAEHNQIVLDIIRQQTGPAAPRVVKSKSMLTEECHLNEFLIKHGVEVVDTDLGERIVQLRQEAPSHIVLPAIHLKKADVSATFQQHLGTEAGNEDPQYLTEAARHHLREKFVSASVAITGVNFAIAETGGFVVCTNEGNADLGVHLADVHIACLGIEKVIPRQEHLGVFLRLLARSATGQPITTYSSHFVRPRAGQVMHIILVDNGRSTQLGRPEFRNSLKCIRCGACFNTCPVYRRSGGHSYHNAVAGPIGSILAPNLDMRKNADLPFASTLCGSCTNVCPVKINIHEQLWHWRQTLTAEGLAPPAKTVAMKGMAWVLGHPTVYRLSGRIGRWVMQHVPALVNNRLNPWYKGRDMPSPPTQSFGEWYDKNRSRV
ncbi:lactate utilization protein B [Spirosoma sordidisoli]|uniref:Lactate utilization protein n=1 Tax=Spirosoma sordidisoli TaxID=2502893 RepID=A0A4Q2UJB6_9BACT|nr:lactate utilization protein B [Spirosoma sordidisoli]RYC69314.1 lactate utilization protein [Spirosoma sordidisoli]